MNGSVESFVIQECLADYEAVLVSRVNFTFCLAIGEFLSSHRRIGLRQRMRPMVVERQLGR
ncbi:MAG: hypothetical protein R3C59_16850 [Planctomycetaceae bacterium]